MLSSLVRVVQVVLAAFTIVQVSSLGIPIPGGLDLAKDNAQYQACKAGGPDTAFAIRYGQGPPITVAYNQCVPFRKDGQIIADGVFCKPATCYAFSDKNCTTGPSFPVPVPVPASMPVPNAIDFVELLGQSAYCAPNAIPNVL